MLDLSNDSLRPLVEQIGRFGESFWDCLAAEVFHLRPPRTDPTIKVPLEGERRILFELARMSELCLRRRDEDYLDHECMSAGERAIQILGEYGLVDEDGRGGSWSTEGKRLLKSSIWPQMSGSPIIREPSESERRILFALALMFSQYNIPTKQNIIKILSEYGLMDGNELGSSWSTEGRELLDSNLF